MANRLVLDMGLNLDPSSFVASDRMTIEEAELRRQIYWALYCVDKLAAGYTGRVCCMLVRLADSHSHHDTDNYPQDIQGSTGMPTVPAHSQKQDRRYALYSVRPELLVMLHTGLIKICQVLEKILLNL